MCFFILLFKKMVNNFNYNKTSCLKYIFVKALLHQNVKKNFPGSYPKTGLCFSF